MVGCRPGASLAVVVLLCLCTGLAVGGVAAGSGVSGPADGPTAERTLNTTAVDPGETVRVTATVSRDSSGVVDYLDEFEPAFVEDASLVSLTANGEPISESLLGEFNDTILVSVENAPAGTVTVTYDVTVPATATPGESYSFDGLAQTGDGDDEKTSVGGDSTLVVGGGAPTFEVALSSVPESVTAGEELAVEASVTNRGNGEGTQQVGLAVDGTVEASTTVSLDIGESAPVAFDYTPTEADTPAVAVAVSSANETVSETVTVDTPASFEVALSALPESVTAGAPLSGAAVVTNTGGTAGTQSVTVTAGGEVVTEAQVTLGPGENDSVAFDYTTTPADTPALTVTASSSTGTATETVAVTEQALFGVSLAGVPASVAVGETLSVGVTVKNTGGAEATQQVSLAVDGQSEASTAVTLDPAESESLSFDYTVTETDQSELGLTVSSANETATETVAVTERAFFAVALPSVPAGATVGTTLSGTAVVTNTGGTAGTQLVTVTAGGEVVAEAEVTVGPGENESVAFESTVTAVDSPAFDVTASSANQTVTETVAVAERAFFALSLSSVPAAVAVDTHLSGSVTVTNTGGTAGTQSVTITVGGNPVTETVVALEPGASDVVAFEYAATAADEPALELAASSDNETATTSVTVTEAAFFGVTLSSVAESVTAGEAVTGEAQITNLGDTTGTQSVTVTVDGTTVAETTVTLEPGTAETVPFASPAEVTDTVQVSVTAASEDDSATATVAVLDPPLFAVSLSAPDPATLGADLPLTATVTNTGDVGATQSVSFAVDGVVQATRTVALAGGAAETVTFAYVPAATGARNLTVATANESAVESVTVQSPANFDVGLDGVAGTVDPGETTTVTVTVENTGGRSGTRPVVMSVDGDPVLNETLTLAGGETVTLTYNHTAAASAPSTLEVAVVTPDDTASASVAVTTDNDTNAGGTNGGDTGPEPNGTDTDGAADDREMAGDGSGPGLGPGTPVWALLGLAVVGLGARRLLRAVRGSGRSATGRDV
jgi:hypothetical protein